MDRRDFLKSVTIATSTALMGEAPLLAVAAEKKKVEEEVSPVEDLMREHGALRRILLIYDEALRRIQGKIEINPAPLRQAAILIRDFIENYHEKLEEEHVFPLLKKARRQVETVDVLLAQHRAGRRVTEKILTLATPANFRSPSDLRALSSAMREFTRMYRPHAAREDTVVFPAFKKVVTPKEYDQLGDRFEDKERKLFGKEGFEKVVTEIAGIETSLGIHDLSEFTPKQ